MVTNRNRGDEAPKFREKHLKLSDFIETIFLMGSKEHDVEEFTVEKSSQHALNTLIALQDDVDHE